MTQQRLPTTTAPGPVVTTSLTGYYTTASAIRGNVMGLINRDPRKLSQQELRDAGIDDLKLQSPKLSRSERLVLAERWIAQLTEYARRHHRLMTDQQYTDWTMGRRLAGGDLIQYIGPVRLERTAAGEVERPNGQLCVVTTVSERHGGRVVTASPRVAVVPIGGGDPQYVDFVFREYSPAWLRFERVEAT